MSDPSPFISVNPTIALGQWIARQFRRTAPQSWTPTTRWAAVSAIAIAGLLAAFLYLPGWLLRQDLGASADAHLATQPTLLDAYRQTVLKVLGGAVVAVGLYFTYRRLKQTDETNRISEQGQVTERFTRAIEQLGSEKTAIQLGGVYALERIMRDSPKDHATVMEVLAAFIRENATQDSNAVLENPGIEYGGPLEVEIRVHPAVQAAVTALGRRKMQQGEPRINLRDVWLRGYDLRRANLAGASLDGAHLEKAFLKEVHLEGAILNGVYLDGASLSRAHLSKAFLSNTSLQRARITLADFRGAKLYGCNISELGFNSIAFHGAIIDDILYKPGMPDLQSPVWPSFLAEQRRQLLGYEALPITNPPAPA